MSIFLKKLLKRAEADEFGGSGGGGASDSGIDMDSAVADIGESLGFTSEANDNDDDGLDEIIGKETPPEAQQQKQEGEDEDGQTAAPADQEAEKSEAAPAAAEDKAPVSWRKEAADQWAALPQQVKEEIQKREADMFRGLEQYKEHAHIGKNVLGIVQPYMPILQRAGIDAGAHISNLLDAHHRLATGTPEAKAAFLQQIAKDYGVELRAASDDEPGSYKDPDTVALQQRMAAIESERAQERQRQHMQVRQTIERQIADFAADPKNVHFDAVAETIGRLINSGEAKDLQDAYDKAVWANPTTRALEQQRLQAEAAEKARKDALEKAEKVRKSTGSNVRTRDKVGGSTAPTGSMEDTMSGIAAKYYSS